MLKHNCYKRLLEYNTVPCCCFPAVHLQTADHFTPQHTQLLPCLTKNIKKDVDMFVGKCHAMGKAVFAIPAGLNMQARAHIIDLAREGGDRN